MSNISGSYRIRKPKCYSGRKKIPIITFFLFEHDGINSGGSIKKGIEVVCIKETSVIASWMLLMLAGKERKWIFSELEFAFSRALLVVNRICTHSRQPPVHACIPA